MGGYSLQRAACPTQPCVSSVMLRSTCRVQGLAGPRHLKRQLLSAFCSLGSSSSGSLGSSSSLCRPPPPLQVLSAGWRQQRQQRCPHIRTPPLPALTKDLPLGGADGEDDAAVATRGFPWSSPYDKEIFQLAIPALFSVGARLGGSVPGSPSLLLLSGLAPLTSCVTAAAAAGVKAVLPNHPTGGSHTLCFSSDQSQACLAAPQILLDPVMGMVDTAIVGRLGTEPLAAVGLSTMIFNFSQFLWNFLLYATTPR
jgi:hypothetical protein